MSERLIHKIANFITYCIRESISSSIQVDIFFIIFLHHIILSIRVNDKFNIICKKKFRE